MMGIQDVLGGPHVTKPPKELDHIRHRRTKNKGHIFEHHFTHPEEYKHEEHAFGDDDSALKHFMTNGTDKTPEPDPEAAGGGPVPGV